MECLTTGRWFTSDSSLSLGFDLPREGVSACGGGGVISTMLLRTRGDRGQQEHLHAEGHMRQTRFSKGSLIVACWLVAGIGLPHVRPADDKDEYRLLLERLRQESPGEYEKVKQLAQMERGAALRFLRERYGKQAGKMPPDRQPEKTPPKTPAASALPARTERFTKLETLAVGDFAIDLCQREDGAFGLGEVRKGKLALRRADFLVTWQVNGKAPRFQQRKGLTIALRDPPATLTFAPEKRECAGT